MIKVKFQQTSKATEQEDAVWSCFNNGVLPQIADVLQHNTLKHIITTNKHARTGDILYLYDDLQRAAASSGFGWFFCFVI